MIAEYTRSSETTGDLNSVQKPPDSQLKVKPPRRERRSFSLSQKHAILIAYDNCQNAGERGALLRREGFYHACISRWRREILKRNMRKKPVKRVDHLLQENARLKKKLARAEAVLELQKKVSDLLELNVSPPERKK